MRLVLTGYPDDRQDAHDCLAEWPAVLVALEAPAASDRADDDRAVQVQVLAKVIQRHGGNQL